LPYAAGFASRKVRHFLDPRGIAGITEPPIADCPIEIFEADHLRQNEIVNGLRSQLIEESLDMRAKARLGPGSEQATDESLRIDGMRPRCVDGAEDEFHLAIGHECIFDRKLELTGQILDVLGRVFRNLNFHAPDAALRRLADAVFLDTAGGGGVCHSGIGMA